MTPTEILLEEAEATYTILERLVRRIGDEELKWTPAEGTGWMTVGQLLMHCAAYGCGKAVQGFVKGDWGPEDGSGQARVPRAAALPSVGTVQEALDLLAKDRRLTTECIVATRHTDLLGRRVAAPWGGEATLFQQVLHMIAHLAQHKGQLFYYLKMMGKDVSTVDLLGA